jgi:hypothetical protein
LRSIPFIIAAFVVGCVPPPRYRSPLPQAERPVTVVAASFEKTWNAVIDVFARENTPIQTLEKASGFIVAERAVIPYFRPDEFAFALSLADCGAVLYSYERNWRDFAPTSAKYNIVVRPQGDGSTVRVTAKFISAPSSATLPAIPARECSSKGVYETETEAAIKEAAEASGSPAAQPINSVASPLPRSVVPAKPSSASGLNVILRMRFIDPDSTLTPIPDFEVALISERGDTTLTRTNASGVVNTQLVPGRYRAVPRKTATFDGRIYSWDVAFTVRMGMAPVDLTQRNARAVPVPR